MSEADLSAVYLMRQMAICFETKSQIGCRTFSAYF